MSNLVFPELPGVDIVVTSRPEWKTDIKEALSGDETCIAQRDWPRWRYTLTFNVLRSQLGYAERQRMMAFFNRHRGAFDDFLFLDPEDNSVVMQPFGTGDGTARLFQLTRPIYDWLEPVWAPASGPVPRIYVGGSLLSENAYSIGSRGQVVFAEPPAAGLQLAWTGTYYMRVRFAGDELEFERFLQGLWKTAKVELLSKVYNT